MEQRKFESGAVRDNAEGKGRFDLMPLMEMSEWFEGKNPAVYDILVYLAEFKVSGSVDLLARVVSCFYFHSVNNVYEFTLDLAKHFENGAKHYGVDNWKKGIPISCYIDSGVRHLMKYYAGYKDERHDVAFVWNMMCAEWTCENMPEMNDYSVKEKVSCKKNEIKTNISIEAQKSIINIFAITENKVIKESIRKVLNAEKFDNEICRKLFEILCEYDDKGVKPYPADLISRFEDEEVAQKLISEIFMKSMDYENDNAIEEALNDYIYIIYKNYISAEMGKTDNFDRIQELFKEQKWLNIIKQYGGKFISFL